MEDKMKLQELEKELRDEPLAALLQENRPQPTAKSRVRVRKTLDRIRTSPWERFGFRRSERDGSVRSAGRLPKRILIPLVAAAVLLITGTAVAAGVLLRDNYSPINYLDETKAEREQKGEAIPDVEAAIASAAPETKAYSITMLPDLPEAELLNEYRQAQGQPAYSEADWGWMRNIKPEIREVLYDGRNCTFTVRLHTDHGMCFDWPREDAGQWVEALMDEARFRREGEDAASELLVSGGIQSFDETGVTLEGEIEQYETPLPDEGRVEITVDVGLRDAKVEDMNRIGDVAVLSFTFTFDVGAAREASKPAVTLRPLSGSVVLTVDDWSDPNKPPVYYNKRVSLDGVVLREEAVYRQTGVYVTYTVESAPEGWTEQYTNALLYPNRYGESIGLTVRYRIGSDGEWALPGYENESPFGKFTCIVPIFPSDYETVKQQGVTLSLTNSFCTAFNGTPVGEDWRYDIPWGSSEMRMDPLSQPIAEFPLPLP